jgi:glycine oxidase
VKVSIIGAGIVGCAIAHELASRGARVRVIDPRPPGHGATGASAGMLAPHIEGHAAALLGIGLQSLTLYDGFIQRVRCESGHAVEYERSGTLQVATNLDMADTLRRESARLTAAGVRNTLLRGAEAKAAEPSVGDDVAAGLLVPDHGYVSVPSLTMALVEAATKKNARFVTERVLGIHSSEHGAQVTTSGGTVDADAVVIAAGSWSPEVAANTSWPPPVKPIRGQLLQLRLPARAASRIVWGPSCYIVPWHDGGVLVGATAEDAGFDESATATGVHQLLGAAMTVLPQLRVAKFEEVRVGLRPMTSDELPIIGPSSTSRHVFYATGHYRNGILLTPLTAALIADLLLDGRSAPELDLLRPSRFDL